MKKIFLLALALLFLVQIAFACDMEGTHGNEITGSAISIPGVASFETGYLLLAVFLFLIIGFGYVIYKINKIENKIKGRR